MPYSQAPQDDGTGPDEQRQDEIRPESGAADEQRAGDQEPDVLLDVPVLKVDEINLEVEDLHAKVSLSAEVLDLLRLNVGADVTLGRVGLDIKGVEAEALLKVRLGNVAAIIERVLQTIDRNPEILEQITRGTGAALRDVGSGAGEAVEEVGTGAGQAVEEVGTGAGQAVEEVGMGAGRAAEEVGTGAGRAVDDVGAGAGRAAEEAGSGAGRAAEGVGASAGRTAEELGERVGRAAGGVRRIAGEAGRGVGRAAGSAAGRGSERSAERRSEGSTERKSDGTEAAGWSRRRTDEGDAREPRGRSGRARIPKGGRSGEDPRRDPRPRRRRSDE
ncbi:MAG: hypothetical protein IJH84_08880 [Saccharopolyspora sp.]|uniref:hypothetical protein n=1 Tax=Saccharopolyspora sp. TaxID=33915 RepID=UPI0025EECBEF|nr:hypothetical protein [Saccharopolyspora sp.]MBQ6641135.1 hypothetical protein [Saccharopolyspora sp.]